MNVIKQLLKGKSDKDKLQEEIELIRQSGLFDEDYYLQADPDVAESGMEAIEHFLKVGGLKNLNPSELFDTGFYRETYADVAQSGVNPLLHFIKFGQSENRKALPDVNRSDDDGKVETIKFESIDSGTQLLQLLILQADYLQFDQLCQLFNNNALYNLPNRAQFLAVLQLEKWLAEGQAELAAQWLNQQPLFTLYWYYQAKIHLLNGELTQALLAAQTFNYQQPKFAEGIYLLADIAYSSGIDQSSWHALTQLSTQSRRARTWQYLARQVSTETELDNYLSILRQWCQDKPNAKFNKDVTQATVNACRQAGNAVLAKQVWHDTIVFHQNRKDGFKKLQQPELSYSQEYHLPLWPMPFQQLPQQSVFANSTRFYQALQHVHTLALEAGIQVFVIHHTLVDITTESKGFEQHRPLQLGVIDADKQVDLHRLLNQSALFFPAITEGDSLLVQHVNGVSLQLHAHKERAQQWQFDAHGVRWQLPVCKLQAYSTPCGDVLIPSDLSGYFSVHGKTQADVHFDWVVQSQNKAIVNQDEYSLYCYQSLMQALISENYHTEAVMLRELARFESKQGYQQLVGSNYTIPTLEDIKADGVQVVLYVTGLEKVAYQGNMWIPVLERLPVNAAVVIREKQTAADLIPTALPVYFMSTMRDLELLNEAGVKTILYPANTQKNVQTLRFHTMNHFFINHGDSDKVVNQSKFLMAYDKLLVAGPLAEQRIRQAGLPVRDNQVEHVGRPQVELMLKKVTTACTSIRTVLYAPTWEGFVEDANYSSVNEMGLVMLEQLLQAGEYQVLFKPHPYTGYNQNGDCGLYLERMNQLAQRYSNLTLVDIDSGIHDWMNQSDLLITDISSVLNDYLYTLKPIILMNPKAYSDTELSEQFPSSAAADVYHEDGQISSMLQRICADDSHFEQRQIVRTRCLGDFPQGSLARFTEVVMQSLQAL